MDEIRKINRLKAVLAEKGKTAKELALDLNVSPVTVSRWSQNVIQPDL
ncbi:MAG: helix-turn-helix transcriptional regulator [Prevotella sp.]|nr:helix-turn-helix transcriptional regulator [Prevotella sp.]